MVMTTVTAGHYNNYDNHHVHSTYEEKTKSVEIPIIKKYGKLIKKYNYLSFYNFNNSETI